MSLVLANIDADFRKPYVLNGFENVGSTETMVLGRHKSQNGGFIRFSKCRNLTISDFPLERPERPRRHKKSMLLDNKTAPFSKQAFPAQAEILRNATLS